MGENFVAPDHPIFRADTLKCLGSLLYVNEDGIVLSGH